MSYFVDLLGGAYRSFALRAAAGPSDGSKQDRVRDYVLKHAPHVFRVADVRRALPGISDQTIRLVLGGLQEDGLMAAEGVGRSATWRRATR